MVYAVTEEGVAALLDLKKRLYESLEKMIEASVKLISDLQENPEGLGPHREQVKEIAVDVRNAIKDSEEPLGTLLEKVREVAELYAGIIAMDYYGGGSDDDTGHGPKVKVLSKRR